MFGSLRQGLVKCAIFAPLIIHLGNLLVVRRLLNFERLRRSVVSHIIARQILHVGLGDHTIVEVATRWNGMISSMFALRGFLCNLVVCLIIFCGHILDVSRLVHTHSFNTF